MYASGSDELWAILGSLLPPHLAQPKGGHRWRPHRPALCGLSYVPPSGMRWNDLSQDLGGGSGCTCWRRLPDWQVAGV